MPTTTNYIWDDQNYLAESDATNSINVVYTNEPRFYGNLVSSRFSSTTSYHHLDALGSTRQLTNAEGSVTDTLLFDAWGNIVGRTGATATRLLWIGQLGYYTDVETGMPWIRRRAYAPTIARWTTLDPSGMSVPVLRHYRYGANSPLSRVDPSGLLECFCKGRCGGLKDFAPTLNAQINSAIAFAWLASAFGAGIPNELLFELLAVEGKGYASRFNMALTTRIEEWIHTHVGGGMVN